MQFDDIVAKLPKPYYRDEQTDIAIYCGDCRELLPLIPDKSIDLVLTDPPYNVGKADWDKVDYAKIFPLVSDIMREGSSVYIFGAIYHYDELLRETKSYWKHLNTCIWLFPNGMNRLIDNWQICYDPIYFGRKGDNHTFNTIRLPYTKGTEQRIKSPVIKGGKEWRPNPEGRKMENVIVVPCLNHGAGAGERTEHPTQKPETLIKYFVEASSNVNEFILDPFLGSGTTAVAAKKLGRKCIGIEISEGYCEIAAKRLSQGVMKLDV